MSKSGDCAEIQAAHFEIQRKHLVAGDMAGLAETFHLPFRCHIPGGNHVCITREDMIRFVLHFAKQLQRRKVVTPRRTVERVDFVDPESIEVFCIATMEGAEADVIPPFATYTLLRRFDGEWKTVEIEAIVSSDVLPMLPPLGPSAVPTE